MLQADFLTSKMQKLKGEDRKIHANFVVQMFNLGGVETQNSIYFLIH